MDAKHNDCPLCAAGIPRKVYVPVSTKGTNEVKYLIMSEKDYEKYKGLRFLKSND
jgi:hypothetical protein